MLEVYTRLVADNPRVAALHPVERYAQDWLDAAQGRSYAQVSDPIRSVAAGIATGEGPAVLGRYHKLVLAYLAAHVDRAIAKARIPPSVEMLLRHEVDRISAELFRQDDAFYMPDNDLFLKDIGMCTARLLPCGAELVEVGAGVPRRLLLRGSGAQRLRALRFFIFDTRGFAPMYALHMDPRNTREFTPQGWERTYVRIAELLELHPEVKGVFGTAWFYDPALETISPHLAYLRKQREAGGARNFRYGENEMATRGALETSRTRRRLYEEGRYRPASHYLVWPRAGLLRWAAARER